MLSNVLINSQLDDTARKDPLTTKEVLQILEHLYDLVLDIEQLRREQSSLDVEDIEVVDAWYVYSNDISRLSLIHFQERTVL